MLTFCYLHFRCLFNHYEETNHPYIKSPYTFLVSFCSFSSQKQPPSNSSMFLYFITYMYAHIKFALCRIFINIHIQSHVLFSMYNILFLKLSLRKLSEYLKRMWVLYLLWSEHCMCQISHISVRSSLLTELFKPSISFRIFFVYLIYWLLIKACANLLP